MTHPYLQHLHDYWYDNRLAIISGATLLISSAVKTLPMPGTSFQWYTFLYDWSHQFLNITNTRLNPTPPATPPLPAGNAQLEPHAPTGIEKELQ